MKTKIVINERKTATIIISPVNINFTDYLFNKYGSGDKKYYFATGTLTGADYAKDIVPFAKKLVDVLNEIGASKLPSTENFTLKDLISNSEDDYKFFNRNTDKDKNWDNQYAITLKNNTKADSKVFLFEDLACTKPIPKEDGWKHTYAVELEVSVGYDDDNLEKYFFVVFHRGISIGKKESTYEKNDQAWDGFSFSDEQGEK